MRILNGSRAEAQERGCFIIPTNQAILVAEVSCLLVDQSRADGSTKHRLKRVMPMLSSRNLPIT